MITEAICKFRNCLKFSLWIDKEPESHFDLVTVEFLVSGSISRVHFDHATAYSRNVSGEDRKILGENISSGWAINYHYDLFKKFLKNACCETLKLKWLTIATVFTEGKITVLSYKSIQ